MKLSITLHLSIFHPFHSDTCSINSVDYCLRVSDCGLNGLLQCNEEAPPIKYPRDENPDSRCRCVHGQVSAVSRSEWLPRKRQQRSGEYVADIQKQSVHSWVIMDNRVTVLYRFDILVTTVFCKVLRQLFYVENRKRSTTNRLHHRPFAFEFRTRKLCP